MIPYLEWTQVQIGPFTLYVWGFFVASGFLLGTWVAAQYARKQGLQAKIIFDLAFWMMIAAMVGGRLGHVLFYDFAYYVQHPLETLYIWEGGLSIFGGFIACVIIGVWLLRKKQVNVWKYADAAVFGLPIGLFIGRIGCFLIHDHPGTATDFLLGVEYPDGVVRHDHGLYLSLNGLVLAMLFWFLTKKERPVGTYIAVFSIWYGTVRFFLDFYRAVDIRYNGLTPGQYFAIVLVGFGVWMIYSKQIIVWKRKK